MQSIARNFCWTLQHTPILNLKFLSQKYNYDLIWPLYRSRACIPAVEFRSDAVEIIHNVKRPADFFFFSFLFSIFSLRFKSDLFMIALSDFSRHILVTSHKVAHSSPALHNPQARKAKQVALFITGFSCLELRNGNQLFFLELGSVFRTILELKVFHHVQFCKWFLYIQQRAVILPVRSILYIFSFHLNCLWCLTHSASH